MNENPEDRYPLYVHHPRPDFPADGGEYRIILWRWDRAILDLEKEPNWEAIVRAILHLHGRVGEWAEFYGMRAGTVPGDVEQTDDSRAVFGSPERGFLCVEIPVSVENLQTGAYVRTPVYAVASIPPEALFRNFKIASARGMHGHWPSHVCDAIEAVITESIRELPPHSPEEKIDEAHFAFLRDWVNSIAKRSNR
ncbi:hypothetical protein [Lyngbya sp. CCY1209]|uniref:hypothetical protein n=1 Tax=Lyngbya sp. CCY1209 TaxID=2886103 RepID=UPI002D20D021|nr:hypothetical protein [Lyngbya sp. CCY1209]MEB3884060.1 hypothetical protein [Lyngbya sp. CCY1209]